MPKVWCFAFLTASASFSSCAKVVGTFASFVLTTRPMFSTATGTPYSFLTAVPYEKAFSVYDGKFFVVALLRKIGVTRPLAASWPVQSCAAVITSGASAAATVPRLSRMSPKFLVTTLIVAPLEAGPVVGDLGDGGRAIGIGPDHDRRSGLVRSDGLRGGDRGDRGDDTQERPHALERILHQSPSVLGDMRGRLGAGTYRRECSAVLGTFNRPKLTIFDR